MLGFAVPVGLVVLIDVVKQKAWRDVAIAVAIGVAILGVLPLWSVETTGDWRLSPLTLYQRDYLPFDKPGFGVDKTPPAKPLNPVNQATYAEFYREHAAHLPSNLPIIIWDRLRLLALSEWSGWRVVLMPLFVIGVFAMGAELWFALVCSIALFAAYLSYGHFSEWTLYYFEGIPVLSVIVALGVWRAALLLLGRAVGGNVAVIGASRRGWIASLILLAVPVASEAWVWRHKHQEDSRYYTEFNEMVDALPKNPTVIFVRYAPRLQAHPNVVQNSPRLGDEPIWIVNDLGARDPELMRFAGPRVPLYFNEDGRRFELARDLLRSH
jgi:hypothetical protein